MIGKYRTKKLKPWGIPAYSWRLPIQNHLKVSTTEKGQNKAKYLSRNYIRRKFVKKTSMPNPIERLGYIKCYSSGILSKMKLQIQLFWSKTVRRKWGDKPEVWVEEGQASPQSPSPHPHLGNPGSIKSPSNSIRCNFQKICSWSRRPKTILEIRKKTSFL